MVYTLRQLEVFGLSQLRVGILGTGSIVRRVMSDFHNGENYALTAFASRTPGRAREFADQYGAPLAFDSYESLAACPEVDLVYIASLHNRHKDHTLLMLNHGKHVLCEKPFALNHEEAEEMIALARKKQLFLMEAMWTRFLPAIVDLKARCDAGELGEILSVTANFSCRVPFDPDSRVFSMEKSGGALLDIGVYPLSLAAHFLGARPASVSTVCRQSPTGSDSRMAIQLGYENGAFAQIHTAVDMASDERAMVHGSKGYAVIPAFWHATRYEIHSDAGIQFFTFPAENEGHHHEFEHAARCIREGLTESPVMPLAESFDILQLMTKVRHQCGVVYPEEKEHAQA